MSAEEHSARLAKAQASLRADQPPAQQWKALCAHLSTLKPQAQASLLAPLRLPLQQLPDAVRVLPADWIHRQRQGQRVPALRLARSLVWSTPGWSDKDLIELLEFPDLPELTNIKLFGQSLTCQSALAIAQSPRCQSLNSLNLTSNMIATQGLLALLASSPLPALQRLFLGRNQIRDSDLQAILLSPPPPALELLDLRDNPITVGVHAQLQAWAGPHLELRLHAPAPKPGHQELPRRKRGRPAKKKPKAP